MPTPSFQPSSIAKYIDHTLLRPEATEPEINQLCNEAKEFGFKGVCVEMRWLPVVTELLKGTTVLPVTVISFPGGEDPTARKVKDALSAIERGAKELDMVMNRELLKQKDYANCLRDVASVVEAADPIPVKVILEMSELTHDEKIVAIALAKAAGARFVKTSTGFSKSGATEEDVQLMRRLVGKKIGVKASGGIRNYADAEKMLRAGADRLGTSASVAIVRGALSSGGDY